MASRVSYGGSVSWSVWLGRSSAVGAFVSDDSGMTRPARSEPAFGHVFVAPSRERVDLGLVHVFQHRVAAAHVAVERGVADRHLRLVAGRDEQLAELVRERHQQHAADARLQILFRRRRAAGRRRSARAPLRALRLAARCRSSRAACPAHTPTPPRRPGWPSEVKRDGSRTPRTRSAPRASTATAAVSAESMPPESPSTTPRKSVLAHVVAQPEHHRAVHRCGSRRLGPVRLARAAAYRPSRHSQVGRMSASLQKGSTCASAPSAFMTNEPPSKTSSSWPPTWLT